MKFKKKNLTENWNNFLGVGPFFQGRSSKGKQINFNLVLETYNDERKSTQLLMNKVLL